MYKKVLFFVFAFFASFSFGTSTNAENNLKTPIPTSPSNNENIYSGVDLSWKKVENAKFYKIEVFDSENNLVFNNFPSEPKTNFSIVINDTYSWRVKACKNTISSNDCGNWSQKQKFTLTANPSDIIKIIFPNGGETLARDNIYEITWEDKTPQDRVPNLYILKEDGSILKSLNFLAEEIGEYNYFNFSPEIENIPDGKYKLMVTRNKNDLPDDEDDNPFMNKYKIKSIGKSDSFFEIKTTKTSQYKSTNSRIKIISPTTNDILIKDTNKYIPIKYEVNLSNYLSTKGVVIFLEKESEKTKLTPIDYVDFENIDMKFNLPQDIQPGRYKIVLFVNDSGPVNDLILKSETFKIVGKTNTNTLKDKLNLKENDLIKEKSSPHVYVIKNGKKKRIKSPKEFKEKGYKWENIKSVERSLLEKIEELKAQIKELRAELKKQGTLIKHPNRPEVYVITKDSKKVKIKSPKEFKEKGYKWEDIKEATDWELSQISDFIGEVPTANKVSQYPNGTLIKAKGDYKVYVIVNGKKKIIPSPKEFKKWGYKWDKIKEVEDSEEKSITEIKIDSELVRAEGDEKIYRIIGDKKLWIPTIKAFLGSGYKAHSEKIISKEDLDDFEDVRYIKYKGKLYELVNGKKKELSNKTQEIEDKSKKLTDAEFEAYLTGDFTGNNHTKEIGANNTNLRFTDSLAYCIKYKDRFKHILTGDILEREILGENNDSCTYVEQMPNNGKMTCTYNKKERLAAAEYYKDLEINFKNGTSFNVALNPFSNNTDAINNKKTNNTLQEFINKGTCIITGY